MQQIVYDSCTLCYISQFTEAVTKRTLLCKGTVVFFINSLTTLTVGALSVLHLLPLSFSSFFVVPCFLFLFSFFFLMICLKNIIKSSYSWRYAVCEISYHSDNVLSVSWHNHLFGIHFRPLWEMALSNRENFTSTETSFLMRKKPFWCAEMSLVS